eukprot:CAMPEP_0181292348 /NCGR_PEP_ID=MMETSP1101-20121128/2459_1 /TAXON_ID=46948 /ORGANISM="Rhodomonas abbreviata, Strain Caron Lab Isolate" /LENGTH=61 /DNA_ID=CAMNT_0023396813 /DNA_START=89 /DNA_END=270 /DNA_ORIENTATION=+
MQSRNETKMPAIRRETGTKLLIEEARVLCADTSARDRTSTWIQKQPAFGKTTGKGCTRNVT